MSLEKLKVNQTETFKGILLNLLKFIDFIDECLDSFIELNFL